MEETNGGEARRRIAIVGGGIAGVLTALSIAKQAPHHLPITLYESASQFGEIGAGVAFGPNAAKAMELVGKDVEQGMDNCATPNGSPDKQKTYFDFWCGMGEKEGTLVKEVIIGDAKRAMVHRAKFLDEMVALIPSGVKVQFKKRLVGLREDADGVTLQFEDGTEAAHSAVIGCDGIKSQTRRLLLGDEDPAAHPVFTGKYVYRGLVPMNEAVEALGERIAVNSQMYLGYHGHMLTFPVNHGKVMNVVAFQSADKWEPKEFVVHADREKMEADFKDWGTNVRQVIKLMQKPDMWALFNHPPARTYHRGRICILGDAAHASSPHLGSGASMAVEDGMVMGMLLQKVEREEQLDLAFTAFDQMRRERTQRLVVESKRTGMLFDFELEGRGDNLEKIEEKLGTMHDWIWWLDVPEHVREAQSLFEKLSNERS